MNSTQLNKNHYNDGYRKSNIISLLAHPIISYDQQSKTKRNYSAIKNLLKLKKRDLENIKYLDYGFGLGSLLIRMRKVNALYGIEISTEAIKNLNIINSIRNIKMLLFEGNELSNQFSNLKFDIISCSHVLEHIDNDIGLLKLFYNHIDNGGFLLLNLPINEIWDDPKHVKKYTVENSVRIVEAADFEIVETKTCDRLTAYILKIKLTNQNTFILLIIKIISAILALLPIKLWNLLEFLLPKQYMCQQLIITAQKK